MQEQTQKWEGADAMKVIFTAMLLIVALDIMLLELGIEKIFLASKNRSFITLGLFLLQEALVLLPLYFFIKRKYRLGLRNFGFRWVGFKNTLVIILKGIGAVIIFNLFFAFLLERFGILLPGFNGQESHIPLFGETRLDLALAVFVLVIAAPVIEEVIFRGFLLQTLLGRFRPWTASCLTAGFFGLVHFEFQSMAIIFFLGLVLNWMYLKSRSIYPGIGFHMVNNALAFTVEWIVNINMAP